jgi:outer membrane protein assembly factor BamC
LQFNLNFGFFKSFWPIFSVYFLKFLKAFENPIMNLKHLLLIGVMATTACSTVNKLLDSDASIDYKSSKAAPKLEVPPDLTQLRTTDRYSTARASSLGQTNYAGNSNSAVLPTNSRARIERLGNTRYLVVDAPAEQVFPIVADFWKDLGFTLSTESAQTGIVETDWAENRAKVPASGLRKMLGGVIDGMFDSGERDKYRSRLERAGNSTEIFISHRGTRELATGTRTDAQVKSVNRDDDAELEADFLRRLMLRFGASEASAAAATASSPGSTSNNFAPARARIVAGKSALELDDGYDAAWRRVGLALDRSGFTTEDRNYSTGEYFIRYARASKDESGFFSKLFGSDKKPNSQKLKLVLQKNTPSTLLIQSENGGAADADIAKNLLNVLRDELK